MVGVAPFFELRFHMELNRKLETAVEHLNTLFVLSFIVLPDMTRNLYIPSATR